MIWRQLPTPHQCIDRLELVFPKTAFDTVLSNPLAGWAVASMIYVEAVVPASGDLPEDATWARPTMVLWMSDEVYARDDEQSRAAWAAAATGAQAKRAVADLAKAREALEPKGLSGPCLDLSVR